MALVPRLMSAYIPSLRFLSMLVVVTCAFVQLSAMDIPAMKQPAFIENRGQFSPDVLFTAQTQTTTIWITTTRIICDFRDAQRTVPMEFPSTLLRTATGYQQLMGDINQFRGKNAVTGIRRFASVLIADVAPGIDMKWYFDHGNPRYDFIVHPYARPKEFSFVLKNCDDVTTSDQGELAVKIGSQRMLQRGLMAYQSLTAGSRTSVPCSFAVSRSGANEWRVGFSVGEYDPGKLLVIDPVVVGSFFGSVGNDKVYDIKVDEAGYIYVGGSTTSPNDLPTNSSKYNYPKSKIPSGKLDGFVAKFTPEGKNLVYYCTIGGVGDDEILSIALDKTGGIIVGGYTYSDTAKAFPLTAPAPDSVLFPGDVDGFISVFKDEGTRLGFSTYYGGERSDTVKKIVFDGTSGQLFVAGATEGNSIPGRVNASYGAQDGFYGLINLSGNQLLYTYFIGGSGNDVITDMELSGDNLYLAGYTTSADLAGLNNTYVSNNDGFYSIINKNTNQLYYTHGYGGLGNDKVWGIAVDAAGTITIAGTTNSPTLEVTTTAFAGSKIGGDDGFVAQFSPNAVMLYSSIIGGSSDDEIFDVKIDKYGQIYLVGNTQGQMSVPKVSADADFGVSLGGSECFMTVIHPNEPLSYNYLTYFGGSGSDFCRSIALMNNHVYCAGFSNSNDFRPLGGFSSQYKGGLFDGFFTVLDLPSRKPILTASILNFGKVTVNSAGKLDSVAVKNRSFRPMTFRAAALTAPFSQIRPSGTITIDPADSMYLIYKYHPQITGSAAVNAVIQYGSTLSDELPVRLLGEGIASSITLSTDILDFGQVQVDSLKRMKITVLNTGTAPGALHFAALTSSVFSYSASIPGDTVIQAGGTLQVEFAFAPKSTGFYTDTLVLESNSVPLRCVLSGEGILSQFRWSIDTVYMNPTRLGTKSRGTVTLKNIGKAQGKITDVFLFNNKRFTLLPVLYPPDSLINSGDSINFTVEYAPVQRGVETETIFANTPSGQLKTYISAKGVFPEITLLSKNEIDFGPVAVNSMKYDSLVFVNDGDDADTLTSTRLTTLFTPFNLSNFSPRYIIQPGKKVVVYIKFTPLFPGIKRDTAFVDFSTHSFESILSGKGVAAQFKITDTIRYSATKVGAKATQTIFIKNIGTDAGLIGNIYLNDTTNSYSFVGKLPQDIEVSPGDSVAVVVQFSPRSIGLKIATSSIQADGKMLNCLLRGEGLGAIFESYPTEIRFDSAEVGTFTSLYVKLYNSGNITERPEMAITQDTSSSFSLASVTPVIKYRNRDSILVKFAPRSVGTKTALLKVWGGVADTVTIYLTGKGYTTIKPTPLTTVLQMPDSIFAAIGEQVLVPVVLRSITGSFQDKISSYSGSIRYNSTVLGVQYPYDSTLVINNDTALLHFSGDLRLPSRGDTLLMLPLTVGLGNSGTTTIELVDFAWKTNGQNIDASSVQHAKSTLYVTNIWNIDGKQRLYFSSGKLLLELTPNTVHQSSIRFQCLPYIATNTLTIYDATGRWVEDLSPRLNSTGELNYDPHSLAKGSYYCIFQSGRSIAIRQFVVE
ncbi:MAG: choice-of-anchor D domain-containing protein [Candidatus Kapaibacterium sp.]